MICTAEETRRTKPPLLFPPHRTHASPVNRCSSFVVSKQSCQTIAAAAIKAVYYTFKVLLHLQCPSGCYRRFVMLLAVPPHSSRQLLCPSRHLVHFFLRYASFHLVRSHLFASRLGIPDPNSNQHTWECTSLSQANPTILTGFHSASLRHSFTSVAFSPPAAHYLARLAYPFRLRSPCVC